MKGSFRVTLCGVKVNTIKGQSVLRIEIAELITITE